MPYMPMVFTSTSGGPTSAATRSTTAFATAGSVASPGTWRIPSGSSFSPSALRSAPATVNPAPASFTTTDRPSGPPAPTTNATRSLIVGLHSDPRSWSWSGSIAAIICLHKQICSVEFAVSSNYIGGHGERTGPEPARPADPGRRAGLAGPRPRGAGHPAGAGQRAAPGPGPGPHRILGADEPVRAARPVHADERAGQRRLDLRQRPDPRRRAADPPGTGRARQSRHRRPRPAGRPDPRRIRPAGEGLPDPAGRRARARHGPPGRPRPARLHPRHVGYRRARDGPASAAHPQPRQPDKRPPARNNDRATGCPVNRPAPPAITPPESHRAGLREITACLLPPRRRRSNPASSNGRCPISASNATSTATGPSPPATPPTP